MKHMRPQCAALGYNTVCSLVEPEESAKGLVDSHTGTCTCGSTELCKVIGVTELQRRFRAVFDEVARLHVPYVLTRGSRPEAALIPYENFLRLQMLREREVLDRVDRLLARLAEQNASYSDEEVAADIEAARAELEG